MNIAKRVMLCSLYLLISSAFCHAQTSAEALRQDPRKVAASFYVYDYKSVPESTPPPVGYEPFYISHFARHGARYCTSEYQHLYDWLSKASQAGCLTDEGKDLLCRYEAFYQKVRSCRGNLTDIGKDQHRVIAGRMFLRFPSVFDGPTRVEAVSTESPRVIISMWSCLSRLVALDSDIDISADASAKYASWLQPGLASNPYYVKDYFISCKSAQDAFSDYFDRTVPWREIAGRFFSSADVLDDVLKITPDRFISTVHGVVTGTYCLDEEQGYFDDVFSKEELTQMWKGVSARYFLDVANYEGSGHHVIDYAAFTVEQIIQSADADMASGATQLRLRFGHDAGIGPLITFLDLDGLGRPASTFEEGIEIFPSYNVPMGASVQLIFYRNADGDILLKALLNEKEASLPFKAVDGPYYRWTDFKAYYAPVIAASRTKIERKVSADSLAFVNAPWKVTDLGKGAQARSAQINMFNSVQSVSFVSYPARNFRTEILHRPADTAGKPSEIGKETGACFMMNAGYFNVKELTPCVYFRQGKQILGHTHPTELYRVDGIFGFTDRKGRGMVVAHCPDTLDYGSVSRRMKSVMASGPLLILDGDIVVPVLMGDKADGDNVAAMKEEAKTGSKIRSHYTSSQFYDRRHPRTAIGTDDSGNIYLVVIDGRFKGAADGASIYETAYICHLLGMTDAINLDGGGSSALWTSTTGVISHPRDNRRFDHEGERTVPNLIAVY